MILRYYELQLKDFCEKFKPFMTKMAIVYYFVYIDLLWRKKSILVFSRLFVCNILNDSI